MNTPPLRQGLQFTYSRAAKLPRAAWHILERVWRGIDAIGLEDVPHRAATDAMAMKRERIVVLDIAPGVFVASHADYELTLQHCAQVVRNPGRWVLEHHADELDRCDGAAEGGSPAASCIKNACTLLILE